MSNYQITEADNLGAGGAKTKAKANLAAVRLLHQLEDEARTATPEEQAVLVKFSGWGTVPDIFTAKPDWADLQSQLREVLTDGEFATARAATLNAHYTAPGVVSAIYDGLERLGFSGGAVLDPSMGATGMFEGLMPESMRDRSDITGIELDSISGRIAQQLYPDATVHVRGLEKTILPNNHFDLAISNVPFSEVKVSDSEYDGLPINTLHDYFFVKSLDKVRPGGLVAFITSTGTMQAGQSEGAREYLSERANLVGAIRLPNDAFRQMAGTDVTTDLILLQKLGDGVEPNGINWTKVAPSSIVGEDGTPLPINEYYQQRPEMLLGTLADDTLYPGRLALQGDGRDLGQSIQAAFEQMPRDIYRAAPVAAQQSTAMLVPPDLQDSVQPGSFVMHDDQLMQRKGNVLQPSDLSGKKLERVRGLIAVREAVQEVLNVQVSSSDDAVLEQAQANLNTIYDQFVEEFGFIHDRGNQLAFRDDPGNPLLKALENYDAEEKTATKTDIFSTRTIQAYEPKTHAETVKEGLLYSLNEKGRVDLPYIAGLVGQEEAEVTAELQRDRLIFLDPQQQDWVTEDDYLSGNVKAKLSIAEFAAEQDSRYAVNVEALRDVQPAPIPPGDIDVRLGSTWIPAADVRDFAHDLLGVESGVSVTYSSSLDAWAVEGDYRVANMVNNTRIHGTERVSALRLLELGVNLKDPVVYDPDPDDSSKRVVNKEQTSAARLKLEDLKQSFKDWVWQAPERTERLTEIYNEKFNTQRPRQYNGAHLELPGSNPAISLNPHQKNAVWRVLQEGNSLLAHVVGGGKTFTMIAAGMEQKRLGIVNKPMYVVPNHMLEQFTGDFKKLYPNANVLSATKEDSAAANRQQLMGRIATGNWDAVIVTHSAFGKLKLSPQAQETFYQREVDKIEEDIESLDDDLSSRRIMKDLERKKKRLETKIEQVANGSGKDSTVTFEQLGVDQIFVDEAHYFKNLGYSTKMYNVAGLSNTQSDRALDMLMKTESLAERFGEGKGTVFATGTPVSNSMAELYTMQRYLQPQTLRELGLESFDAWASTFGETVTAPEITPAGGYKVKTRFSQFINVPELMNNFREVADIQTAEMLNLPTPELKGGKPTVVAVPSTDLQLEFVEELASRAENVTNVDPRDDNMLLITTDGRKASLDMRLINPNLPDDPNTKVNRLVADALEYWGQTRDTKATHLVFCDLGTPKEDDDRNHFSIYDDIKKKLVDRGIPESAIAFAQDYKSDAQKLELQQKFNAGKVHLLISGSQLETGFNGQKRLGRISHIGVPWRPDQVEQRDGRGLRQGNQNAEVEIVRYVTQGRDNRPSFDSYSWQTLETKKKTIAQVMSGQSDVRRVEDVAEAAMTYAEVKAIATGNPLIMEKAEVDNQVSQLSTLKKGHLNAQWSGQQRLKALPGLIDGQVKLVENLRSDASHLPKVQGEDRVELQVMGQPFSDYREGMKKLVARALIKEGAKDFREEQIGQVGDFSLSLVRERWGDKLDLLVRGQGEYRADIQRNSYVGTEANLVDAIEKIPKWLPEQEAKLERLQHEFRDLSQMGTPPFSKEAELQSALKRQQEINKALGLHEDNAQAAVEDAESEELTSLVEEVALQQSKELQLFQASPESRVIGSEETAAPSEPVHQVLPEGNIERNVAKLLDQSGLAEAIAHAPDEEFHLRVENEPYMPLVVERHGEDLYLTHYREQNGDTFIDAEMVLKLRQDGKLQFQETAVLDPLRGGEHRAPDRGFAQTFSRNLLDQGFAEAATVALAEQTVQVELHQQQAQQGSEEQPETQTDAATDPEPLPLAPNATNGTDLEPAIQAPEPVESDPLNFPNEPVGEQTDHSRGRTTLEVEKSVSPSTEKALAITQQVIQQHDPATATKLSAPEDPQSYSPSLAALRTWFSSAKELGRDTGHIAEVAQAMLDGTPEARKPSSQRDPNYRNPGFTLPPDDLQAMKSDITDARVKRVLDGCKQILKGFGTPDPQNRDLIQFAKPQGDLVVELDRQSQTLTAYSRHQDRTLLTAIAGKVQGGEPEDVKYVEQRVTRFLEKSQQRKQTQNMER